MNYFDHDFLQSLEEINVLDLGSLNLKNESSVYDDENLEPYLKVHSIDALERNEESCFVIGDGSERRFHITKLPTCSSLFEPNLSLTKTFSGYSEYLDVIGVQEIKTEKLDSIFSNDIDFDYIKSDLQGSDLMAIIFGRRTFDKALLVEVETEFVQQYKEQPLFSDVEIELRRLNYSFHTFTGYGTRSKKPLSPENKHSGVNQWLWANSVFVKADAVLQLASPSKLKKVAYLLHYLYKSFDYVAFVLTIVDEKLNTNYSKHYLSEIEKHNKALHRTSR